MQKKEILFFIKPLPPKYDNNGLFFIFFKISLLKPILIKIVLLVK